MRYFALYYPRTDDMSTPDINQPPFMLFHEDAFSRSAVESYRDQYCTTAVIVPVDAEVAGGDPYVALGMHVVDGLLRKLPEPHNRRPLSRTTRHSGRTKLRKRQRPDEARR